MGKHNGFRLTQAKAESIFGAASSFPLSRQIFIDAFAFVTPLLFALVLIKIYKVTFLLWPITRTFGWTAPGPVQVLKNLITSPLLISVLTLLLFLFCCRIIARRQYWDLLSVFAVVAPMVALLNAFRLWKGKESIFSLAYSMEFLQGAGSELIRWSSLLQSDLFFILCYFIVACIVRAAWPRCFENIALYIINSLLMLLAGLELANYAKTGITDSGALLLYLLQNFSDLAPLIRSEFDLGMLLTATLPLALLLLMPALKMTIKNGNLRARPILIGVPTLAVLLLIAEPIVPGQLDQEYYRFRKNVFLQTANAFWRDVTRSFEARADSLTSNVDDLRRVALEASAHTDRLNIVVVMLESVRAKSTDLYNPTLGNTPFLSKLAEKSLVVEEMYAVIPRTAAAWVSVLQGIYPTTNTVMMRWAQDYRSAAAYPSLPRLLRPHGYHSAFFVPTHMNYENEGNLINNMDFDRVVMEKDYDARGFERTTYFGLEDRVMINPIMSWVDEQTSKGRPFFLAAMTNVGHHNYEVPQSWSKLSYVKNKDENNYLNCIAYIDDFLARLFHEFERRQLLKSTVFLILGDHGDSFGEHGVRQRAMTLFEEDLHVPALVYAPALFPSGSRITGVRQQIDILPTVAHVLGLNVIGGRMPGVSLFAQPDGNRTVFFSTIFDDLSLGMRRGSRKYIYNFDESPIRVYDMSSDRNEQQDVVSTTSRREIEAAKREMLEWSVRSKRVMLSAQRPIDHLAVNQVGVPQQNSPAVAPARLADGNDR